MIKKSTIIKISIIFVVTVTIIILFIVFSNRQDTNNSIKINNISQYYNDNILNQISNPLSETLSVVLQLNSINNTPKDITIRDSAPVLYQFNSQTNFYSGKFIIDIPSIQQSYQISFNVPQDTDTVFINPVEVTCLSGRQLIIYSDFQCQNRGQH